MESPPLRRCLRSLGRVQHHLHTIVVGLEGVEEGVAKKSDELNISWNPSDLIGSSREARQFALRATLVLVAEELNEYSSNILKHRGVLVPHERSDRLRGLGDVEPSYLQLAPLLISHWRNRIIHRRSRAQLTAEERKSLLDQSEAIFQSFQHLDAKDLLDHFEKNQPKLKEVTTLLAMSIRFVRIIDARLPELDNAADVRRWLESEDLLNEVSTLEKESRNSGSLDPRGRAKQYLLTMAPSLADSYYRFGVGHLSNDGV